MRADRRSWAKRLQFQGVPFAFEEDAAETVETATLAPAGCAGPFQLSAPIDQVESGLVDQLYATVGTRLLSYRATDTAQISASQDTTTPIQEEADQGTGVAAETGTPAPDADVGAEATPPSGATDESGVVETEPAGTAQTDVAQSDETATAAEEGTLPPEVVLEGARFGFDRQVPVDPAGLEQVGEDDGVLLFAISGGPPFDRVYGARRHHQDVPGRYLAEQPVGPDGVPSPEGTCLAETANFSVLDVGGAQYVYAGPEPDLTTDQLQAVLADR